MAPHQGWPSNVIQHSPPSTSHPSFTFLIALGSSLPLTLALEFVRIPHPPHDLAINSARGHLTRDDGELLRYWSRTRRCRPHDVEYRIAKGEKVRRLEHK